MLDKAIRCFLAQSYCNKELIIVHPAWDSATRACIANFNSEALKPHPIDARGLSLGELRNISLEVARGAYACIWDDDDWHSPEQLAVMHCALASSRKAAALLARLLIYDASRRQAFFGYERLWENTLFFHRKTVQDMGIQYPAKNTSEDYEFVNALIAANLIYPVYEPTLYIYHVSGSNICSSSHFEAMLKRSSALSDDHSALVRRSIEFHLPPQTAHIEMQSEWFKAPLPYVRRSAVPRS